MPADTLDVVVLDHCAQLSGAELALVRLLPHVRDVRYTVVLAEDGPLVDRLRGAGIAVEVLPMAPRAAALRRDELTGARIPVRAAVDVATYTWKVYRYLRRVRPDAVHTNSNKSHLYGGVAARAARVPHLWHARDRVARPYMPRIGVLVSRAAAWTLPSFVVANSRSTLQTVVRRGPGARPATVLAEPVLPQPSVPRPDSDGGELVVGMVGRLTPWKGQDVFLRAFVAAFPAGGARAVLVGSAMFGEADYEVSLRQLTEDLGLSERVSFLGFTDDVAGELARMDVLVHASVIPEPFGQVVIEGMAAGLPVLAADDGGPAEILKSGVTGLLYPPGDVPALAEHLRAVAADPHLRRALGDAARGASAAYDPDHIAAGLRSVYSQMTGAR